METTRRPAHVHECPPRFGRFKKIHVKEWDGVRGTTYCTLGLCGCSTKLHNRMPAHLLLAGSVQHGEGRVCHNCHALLTRHAHQGNQPHMRCYKHHDGRVVLQPRCREVLAHLASLGIHMKPTVASAAVGCRCPPCKRALKEGVSRKRPAPSPPPPSPPPPSPPAPSPPVTPYPPSDSDEDWFRVLFDNEPEAPRPNKAPRTCSMPPVPTELAVDTSIAARWRVSEHHDSAIRSTPAPTPAPAPAPAPPTDVLQLYAQPHAEPDSTDTSLTAAESTRHHVGRLETSAPAGPHASRAAPAARWMPTPSTATTPGEDDVGAADTDASALSAFLMMGELSSAADTICRSLLEAPRTAGTVAVATPALSMASASVPRLPRNSLSSMSLDSLFGFSGTLPFDSDLEMDISDDFAVGIDDEGWDANARPADDAAWAWRLDPGMDTAIDETDVSPSTTSAGGRDAGAMLSLDVALEQLPTLLTPAIVDTGDSRGALFPSGSILV